MSSEEADDKEQTEGAVSADAETREEAARRIHLRDITADTPLDGEAAGVALRTARLKTGKDLKSVSDDLRIRRPYLEALEESRHADLPGRPYAIGFVRTYATYLGLDAADLVERYKQETLPDDETAHVSDMSFPEVVEDARLPKGSLLIVALLLGAGIYGAWLLSVSADKMVTERVPPVPERLEPRVNENAPAAPSAAEPVEGQALPGDGAAAAQPDASRPFTEATVGGPVTDPATDPTDLTPVAPTEAVEAAVDPDAGTPVSTGEVDVAAVEPAEPVVDDLALANDGARIYGLENSGARVVVRATKRAWLRIEAGDGSVLLNQTLESGEMFRAPVDQGAILVARDAGAFEIYVDGQSLGVAGPSGLVLTGKSLNPEDLIR